MMDFEAIILGASLGFAGAIGITALARIIADKLADTFDRWRE